MALHDAQELNDNLRRGADEHVVLAATLGVDGLIQAVILARAQHTFTRRSCITHENGFANHVGFGGLKRQRKHDVRAQDEYRPMESTNQAGIERRGRRSGMDSDDTSRTRNQARAAQCVLPRKAATPGAHLEMPRDGTCEPRCLRPPSKPPPQRRR